MKNLTFFLILLLFFELSRAQTGQLIGKWQAANKSADMGNIELKADKTGFLHIEGQTLVISEYSVDFSKRPVLIEMKTTVSDKEVKLYALVEFMDNNTIKWELFPPDSKNPPVQFSAEKADNQIVLKKGR